MSTLMNRSAAIQGTQYNPGFMQSSMHDSMVNPATRTRIHVGTNISEYARILEAGEKPQAGYVKFKLLASAEDPGKFPESFALQNQCFTVLVDSWVELDLFKFLVVAERLRLEWTQEAAGAEMIPDLIRRCPIVVESYPKLGKYAFGEITQTDLGRAQRLVDQPFIGADLVGQEEEYAMKAAKKAKRTKKDQAQVQPELDAEQFNEIQV